MQIKKQKAGSVLVNYPQMNFGSTNDLFEKLMFQFKTSSLIVYHLVSSEEYVVKLPELVSILPQRQVAPLVRCNISVTTRRLMKEWAKKAFGEELGSGAFTLVNGELLNALRTLVDFQDIAESVTNVVFGNNVM